MHQIGRLTDYMDAITPLLSEEEKDRGQFILEMVAIVSCAFIEEYFKCLFTVGTIRRAAEVRDYLRRGNNRREVGALNAGCNLGAVVGMMHSRVRFARRNAKTLERTFDFLFGFDAFPDEDCRNLLVDLARVRNLVVHEGGWPDERHAKNIRYPGVIVETGSIDAPDGGKIRFYKLDLINAFMMDTLQALAKTAMYHHEKLSAHPDWSTCK